MNKAVEIYTAVPKMHNCAQAVVCGGNREDLYDDMKSCGGGKAPGGLCGALYGAMQLTPPSLHGELTAAFKSALGDTTCAGLKGSLKVPCADCVRCAAELADKFQGR